MVNDARMASASPIAAPVRSAAITVGLAALAAAALVLFIAGDLAAAAGFLAAGLVSGGVALAWRMVAPKRLVTLLDASDTEETA